MTAAASSLPACLLAETTIVQPTHLEGDPTLATEILPGPPSLASIRQGPKKGDPKRPTVPLSYLPLYDPGTTYSGLVGGMATLDDSGSRRKRARVDSRFSSRSQRASARGLTHSVLPNVVTSAEDDTITTSQPISESVALSVSNNEELTSTLNSSYHQNLEESSSKNRAGRPKKAELLGTSKDKGVISVKEEPLSMQLSDITPRNDDHCSSCRSTGALVYCDGCPRAFHLWCLDPPMEAAELSDGDRWFCPRCRAAESPSQRLPPSFLSPLLHQVYNSLPKEFQLPEEIRYYFRDVATASNGSYVDSSAIKSSRNGRHGLGVEEREPYRLRDGKGLCTLCFGCGKSTLPDELIPSTSSVTDARSQQWKSMISCDYCNLHWHLDCLDPPVTTMPPFGRKWKCPNHASNITPKRRVPKNNTVVKDISGPNQYNNGNVEVINMEDSAFSQDKLPADDVLINGTRYRVPERAIILDFWNKTQHPLKLPADQVSVVSSSPLTSLTSLDGDDDRSVDDDTLDVAQMLCNMRKMNLTNSSGRENDIRRMKEIAVQTDLITSQSENSETLSNGVSEKLSRQSSSTTFGIDSESLRLRKYPNVGSPGKWPARVTRQRATRRTGAIANALELDMFVDATSNIPGSSISSTPNNADVKSTSLKIRIPVLSSKILPTSDPLIDAENVPNSFGGSKKESESSSRPSSSRPVKTSRLKPPKQAVSILLDGSSSRSELTSNDDDSRSNSEIIAKSIDNNDSGFIFEPKVSSRIPVVGLQTRSSNVEMDLGDSGSLATERTPRKRRRIPSLSYGKNEDSSSAADTSPLIGISDSRASRSRRPKRSVQGRKSSSISIQRSDVVKSNSISDSIVTDEEGELMAENFNSTSLGQSAIPIPSLS